MLCVFCPAFGPRVGRLQVTIEVGPGDFAIPHADLFKVNVAFFCGVFNVMHDGFDRTNLDAFQLVAVILLLASGIVDLIPLYLDR